MLKNLYSASLLMLIISSNQASAENLLQIIKLAKNYDATYQSAIHKASSDKESYTQARSRFMPKVSYQYSNTNVKQEVNESANFLSPVGEDSFGTVNHGLTINQTIFNLESWSLFQKSKSTITRADSELLQAEHDLLLRASEAYFLVLEREDQLSTVRDEKVALNKHFSMATQKKRAGLGRTVDVDTAEARYLESVAKEIELETRLSDSLYALAEITGSVMNNLMRLSEKVEYKLPAPNNVLTWIEQANKANPAIVAKQQSIVESDYEVDARKSKHYPTVNLSLTEGKVDTQESIFSDSSNIDSRRIELRVDVPIFEGFYTNSRVKQALTDRYRAQEDLRKIQRENERTVRDAFRRINASIMQVKALTRSAEAQERMLHLKTKGYNAGRYTLLEVLDAQKDFSNQKQARTKARYDYVLNLLRLRVSTGIITMQDIENVNAWLTVARSS